MTLKFGRGLLCPFQRDGKGDFANSDGEDLLHSDLTQLIGMSPGELPWDMKRGCDLKRLKHRKGYSPMTQARAHQSIDTTINNYESRLIADKTLVEFGKEGETTMKIKTRLRLKSDNRIIEVERTL